MYLSAGVEQAIIPISTKSGPFPEWDAELYSRVTLITDMSTEVSCSSLVREDQGGGKDWRDKAEEWDRVG